MTVHGNAGALFAIRQMNTHSNSVSKALQRLSSGYRINSAADDPAGLAISERMRAQITGTRVAVRNAQTGLDMVDTADGALAGVHRMLNRLVEICERAADGTIGDEERNTLQREVDQIMEELGRTAEATNFGQKPLLDGEGEHNDPTILQIGTTSSDYDQLAIKLPQLKAVLSLLDGIDVRTQESAGSALENVNKTVDRVSEARGDLGAASNRLQRTIASLENSLENLTDAESRIRDANMALEAMNFTRASFLQQAAQAMMVHAMQQPQRVLELLKMQ